VFKERFLNLVRGDSSNSVERQGRGNEMKKGGKEVNLLLRTFIRETRKMGYWAKLLLVH